MKIEDIKLNHFTNDVMAEVTEKKQKMLEEMKKRHEETYAQKEDAYLAEAYDIIQEALKKIDLEKSERISQVVMENKRRLLHERTRLVESIFEEAMERIHGFTKQPEYPAYLAGLIEKGIEQVGEGEIEVTIQERDKKLLPELEKQFEAAFSLAPQTMAMGGGCKVYNRTRKRLVDLSFAALLEEQRDDFMYKCNLAIE